MKSGQENPGDFFQRIFRQAAEPIERIMPKLTVQQGDSDRREIDIPATGQMVIGRDQACEIALPHGDVSRRHAQIISTNNCIYVEDLGSHNGTFLNQSPVSGRQQLKHMDVLQVGRNVFVFTDDDADVGDNAKEKGKHTQAMYTLEFLKALTRRVEKNVCQVFKGSPTVTRNVILAMLADSHILIEDAPGVGKSILAQAMAKSIQGIFKRIQFTPDMLPSDISGLTMYNRDTKKFSFMPGPIFGNVILADEINRTTPRTQSALLECMNDAVVTVDGTAHILPRPFFVIATQNPSEYHGTYPLPEAQLDRFLMRISIGYPTEDVEREILTSQTRNHPLNSISYVARAMDIVQCQALVRNIHVSEPVKDYIIHISQATRTHHSLSVGCSPRGALALMRAVQALAAYSGRHYVLPKDVRELAAPVLSHRIQLKLRAQAEWQNTEQVVADILKQIPLENEEEGTARYEGGGS